MNGTIIKSYLNKLKSASIEKIAEIRGWRYRIARYVSPGNYEYETQWMKVEGNELFPKGVTVFFEAVFKFPEIREASKEKKEYLFLKVNNVEGIMRVDGKVYHGMDINRDRIPVNPEWSGKKILIGLEVFCKGTKKELFDNPSFAYSYMAVVDKVIEKYYYDLKLAWDTYNMDSFLVSRFSHKMERAQEVINNAKTGYLKPMLTKAIDESLKYLDISLSGDRLTGCVKKAGEILEKGLCNINDGNINGSVSLVGHTHIDVAWLWQIKDTVRKCAHSFSNVLRLMEQYPEFSFSCSQPQLYQYTKDYYPEVYRDIKKYIDEGRWEVVGPMWVESDCNVISGESLIRQILHGSRFMMEEFGQSSSICWLPDTFGFQSNMPQILKKAGIDSFFSYKLHWQAENRFPYGSFRWRGIDGSEVIASVPELCSAYNGNPTPSEIKYAQDANLQKYYMEDVIFSYGWGDGGGGPTPEMVEYATRMKDYPGLPACTIENAKAFFSRLGKKKELLPVWFGELYLETHRGTYTTHAYEKKMNRMSEILYQKAEKINVIAERFSYVSDWEALRDGWNKILLLQFHDILPGSSVRQVYEDSQRTYDEIMKIGYSFLNRAMAFFKESISENTCRNVMVFNTLSWDRTGIAQVAVDEPGENNNLVIHDENGDILPSIMTFNENGQRNLLFLAKNIPSLGFKVFEISAGGSAFPGNREGFYIEQANEKIVVKNGLFKAAIDSEGRIEDMADCEHDRDVLSAPANEFEIFLDGPQQEDAWNLYEEYKMRKLDYEWKNKIEVKENNALRAVVHVEKTSEKAVINQDIIFYSEIGRIDFITRVDWRERHKLLRVIFPVNINSDHAAFETGLGTFMRPTTANTRYDKSRFEVVAHKWMDISEGEYGVSVLNDCKYGHSVDQGKMAVTLLRSTSSPDESADMGIHHFTYSLYPHAGDWRDGQTVRKALELNTPFSAFLKNGSTAAGCKDYTVACVDNKNLVIDTLKKAEDGKGIIMRLYEAHGNRGKACVKTGFDFENVMETDLLERSIGDVETGKKCFRLKFSPYEIKTFRLVL